MADSKVRNEIDARNRQLAEATKKKSARDAASLYAENATFVGPDGAPVVGRSAIEAMWKAQFEAGLHSVDLKTVTVEDLAPGMFVEVGSYEIAVGEVKDAGRYMVVWKRSVEGALQLYVDVPVSHGAAN